MAMGLGDSDHRILSLELYDEPKIQEEILMDYLELTHILEMLKQKPINFHLWLMSKETTGLMWLTPRGEI